MVRNDFDSMTWDRHAEYLYRRYISRGWMPRWVPKLNDHPVLATFALVVERIAICAVGGFIGFAIVRLLWR